MASGLAAMSGWAQDVAVTGGAAVSVENPQPVTVAFRLVEWKAAHIHNPDETAAFISTLQQLGCEVVRENHGGHEDIRFRTVSWRPLTVETENLAHEWRIWLTNNGFETVHSHPTVHGQVPCQDDGCENAAEDASAHLSGGQSASSHAGRDHAAVNQAGHDHAGHDHAGTLPPVAAPETRARVVFHLPAEQTRHFENPNEAAEFSVLATALGCQIAQDGHGGHQDMVVRCPDKRWIEFADHATAHSWIEWLKSQGFATEHAD
jgi:hypothetical protein